jgi:hypothetical protein
MTHPVMISHFQWNRNSASIIDRCPDPAIAYLAGALGWNEVRQGMPS